MAFDFKQYLRLDKFPHIWCAGCGHGIVLQGVLRAIHSLNLDKNKVAVVSGIGCSSRAVGYIDFNTLHTAHGRAIPFATGLKIVRPELTVVVLGGDGDIAAIGGNHFIHAGRRNIDITVVVFNNSIYGMTSGQYSPLTPCEAITTTSPYGNIERSFDLCELAKASGATYIARSTAFHVRQLPSLVEAGIRNCGFSLIEVITQCPIYFGRMNLTINPVDMLKWQRDNAINLKQASLMSEEEKKGKFVIGELYKKEKEELTNKYVKIAENLKKKETS
jgi:2-oxoglutarate ferredoxin oxidoreductase subunit beta